MNLYSISLIILIVVWFIFFIKILLDNQPKKKHTNTTRFMARVGIFGAIATILYVVPGLKFSLPGFPSFLEIHFDEVPVFIAGFAYGPWAAIGILVVKTIIKLPFTSTMCVGELSDLIFSAAFIIPASIIYRKKRTIGGALIGLVVGALIQVGVAMIGNVYVMIPFYLSLFFKGNEHALLAVCQMANPNIKDIGWSYAFFAVLPFNLIKDLIVVVLTALVYKSTHKFIDRHLENNA